MGRTAGQPARVAVPDRPSVRAQRARASLEAAPKSAPRPGAPQAPQPPVAPRAPVSSVAPRPTAECHTVREILPPWHVLQDKLQKRAEAVATGSVVPADQ